MEQSLVVTIRAIDQFSATAAKVTGGLSAGSHTFKIQFKRDSSTGTATIYASTSVTGATLTVLETSQTT